jgi:hypothetical protein
MWKCLACTFENDDNDVACLICQTTSQTLLHALNSEEEKKIEPRKTIPEFIKKSVDKLDYSREVPDKLDEKILQLVNEKKQKPIILGNYEIWPHGLVVFRNAIDSILQEELMNDTISKLNIRQDMEAFKGADAKGPPPKLGFSFQTNWVSNDNTIAGYDDVKLIDPQEAKVKMPVCFELAKNLYHKFRHEDLKGYIDKHNEKFLNSKDEGSKLLKLPAEFDAYSLWARAYAAESRLAFHNDPPKCNGAFIISIGSSIDFSYSRGLPDNGIKPGIHFPTAGDILPEKLKYEAGLIRTVKINSGDAVYFNGGVLFHAVTKIYIDDPSTGEVSSKPSWWTQKEFVRIGLQMREKFK